MYTEQSARHREHEVTKAGGLYRRGLLIADQLAALSGVLRMTRRMCRHAVTVLMYHRVLPDTKASDYPLTNLVMKLSYFRQQVDWLTTNCRMLTMAQAVANQWGPNSVAVRRISSNATAPIVCVTLDDGYADNAVHAAKVLDEAGCPATFFVSTRFVEGEPLWFDVACRAWEELGPQQMLNVAPSVRDVRTLDGWLGWLKRQHTDQRVSIVDRLKAELDAIGLAMTERAMSPEQLRELADRGHEIASHTVTHPILTRCDNSKLRIELTESRRALERWTGREIVGLSYPNGDADARVVAATAETGYGYACSTERGLNTTETSRFRLRRRMITTGNSGVSGRPSRVMFAAEVLGWHDRVRQLSPK